MSIAEREMIELENELPSLAGAVFAKARNEALASGESVLEADGGTIYEVFPDGSRVARKKINPPTKITAGARFILQ